MKKVTAVLLVYAILVIASSVFWVWSALSKSTLTADSHQANNNLVAEPEQRKQDAEATTNKSTELTGRFKEGVKAVGQANDIVKSNDL
jgi:hypothetical protein